ncbi:MAG: nicotinate phosphoribosyltransferase [Nitrososphaerota archaeon]|nr:nicotinate phosphoribosyltransferase [Nitrososphaerota archaeon]
MSGFDLDDRTFWLASGREIKKGDTTDVYFRHTEEVLHKSGYNPRVVMEVYARDLPYEQNWGILSGVYEVAKLLEGIPVEVRAMEEGSVFLADGSTAIYEPLLTIEGRYLDFLWYETAILGLLSSSTSISTRAARYRQAAGRRTLLSFGTRRVHPALSALVERACYIAGFDGVSNVLGAKLLKVAPAGTMPHALVQIVGDPEKAWRLFDKYAPREAARIVLVDTFWDEKTEAIRAYETLGKKLWGIRLDTPASRRGNFRQIVEEVRWELNIRGGKHVKIIASGRLDEDAVAGLRDVVDGFGVGTAVAYPPVIDLSAKIVEVRGRGGMEFRAKRGGLGGMKQVYRGRGYNDTVTLEGKAASSGEPLLKPLMKRGEIVRRYEGLEAIRARVGRELKGLSAADPKILWR